MTRAEIEGGEVDHVVRLGRKCAAAAGEGEADADIGAACGGDVADRVLVTRLDMSKQATQAFEPGIACVDRKTFGKKRGGSLDVGAPDRAQLHL